jgi:hypothetical protein
MAATAYPTVVLITLCVPGHLASMIEAGKRLLGRSRCPMSLTVLITQISAASLGHAHWAGTSPARFYKHEIGPSTGVK